MEQPQTVVRLATRDWLWLIVVVVGAAIGNVVMVYAESAATQARIQDRMDTLDDRWQQRTMTLAADVKADIRRTQTAVDNLADSVPPDWFRSMVERLQVTVDRQQMELATLREEVAKMKGNGNDN